MRARSVVGRWLASLALAACLMPATARAGTYDIFGDTPRDIGMGGAMTAAVIGYSALFYNPAALTLEHSHMLGIGFHLSVPSLEVEREHDTAESPTTLPETHLGATLGWVKPFGGIFDERLAVGLSLSLPLQRLARVQGIDPESPQFYLYQNLQDKLLINLGAAYDITDWFSVGVGGQILADIAGSATLDIDILGGTFDRRELAVELAPSFAPFAGIHIRPPLGAHGGQIKIGVAFRGASSLRFALPIMVSEGDALSLKIKVSQTVLYTPNELAFGLSYTLDAPAITFALDLTYALWSDAPDPSPRLSVEITGKLLSGFGLDHALDLSTRSAPIDLGFSDTVTIRGGVEWHALEWLTVRGGYFFRPTPAPLQTGSTAYLDNDAHVVSLGVGFSLRSPLQDKKAIVDFDLSAQATILPRRTVYRADAGNPVGDLSHGGVMWHFGVAAMHRF